MFSRSWIEEVSWRTEAALRLARTRWEAARASSTLFLGRMAGHVYETYVRSLVAQMNDGAIRSHVEDVRLLAGAHVERYDFDARLGMEYTRTKSFDDRHLYRLSNVRVSPRSGLVWLPDGRILGESYGSLVRLMGWGAAVHESLLPCARRIEGPVIALPDTGYYHWLLEALPAALHCINVAPEAAILTSEKPARYVEQALEMLSPRGGVVRSSLPISADHLVLAAIDPISGFVPAEDIAVLRERILPLVPRGSLRGDAVYVSRRGSSRSPTNEKALETAFAHLGFNIVRAETVEFSEQVDIFRSAQFIAGVHGAGLANQVWSDALTGVVEVLSEGHFNDCFARLAVVRGARYTPSMSRTIQGGREWARVDDVANAARDQMRTA